MKGKLLIISGISAAGKGTIAAELVKKYDDFVLSISATTRDKRNGEEDKVHYFFVSKDEFELMIKNDDLIEYANYVGNYYGTPKKYVLDKLNEGKNVILEIEMQGALKVKELYNDAVLIYIIPESANVQKERLIKRGRENEVQIAERLRQAVTDASYAKYYDYILVNKNLDSSINDVLMIVDGKYDKNKNIESMKILNKIVTDIKGGI